MPTTQYTFTTPGNYTYDLNTVEVTGGQAQLRIIDASGKQFTQPFDGSPGFTYDQNLAVFTESGTFGVNFSQHAHHATWAAGNTIGTLSPTPPEIVSGEVYSNETSSVRYVYYSATNNADSAQTGVVRFKVRPLYTNNPTANGTFFSIHTDLSGGVNNAIQLTHVAADATLNLLVFDDSGAVITNTTLPAWQPAANQQYEFELNYDFTTGDTRLFIDGAQHGNTITDTGTRNSANINYLTLLTDISRANPAAFTLQDFVVDSSVRHTSNYTPGYTVATVNARTVRQKKIIDASFGVNFNTDGNANANWADGIKTATFVGNPIISGGKLDLRNGVGHVRYDATSNCPALGSMTARFKVTPNWSGAPPSTMIFFTAATDFNNRCQCYQLPSTGRLVFYLTNDSGGFVNIYYAWGPVAGTEYEIEIGYDLSQNFMGLWIDGVLVASSNSMGGTRTVPVNDIRLGGGWDGVTYIDAQIDDVIIYPTLQHTADYTPGYIVSDNNYSESVVVLPTMTHNGPGTITTLDSLTVTDAQAVRYVSDGRYWDGAQWAVSDNSYAQANDVLTINNNLASLSVAGQSSITTTVVFPDSPDAAYVDLLQWSYTGGDSYPVSVQTVVPLATVTQDGLSAFSAVSTNATFVLRNDNVDYYWDGMQWVQSDLSVTQSNDAVTIDANLASFPQRGVLVPVVLLASPDGVTQSSVDDMSITYDYFGGSATIDNTCVVWGYLYDGNNQPRSGVTITVRPEIPGIVSDKVIDDEVLAVTTDSSGYWEVELVVLNTRYVFDIDGFVTTRFVPDVQIENFNNLTTI